MVRGRAGWEVGTVGPAGSMPQADVRHSDAAFGPCDRQWSVTTLGIHAYYMVLSSWNFGGRDFGAWSAHRSLVCPPLRGKYARLRGRLHASGDAGTTGCAVCTTSLPRQQRTFMRGSSAAVYATGGVRRLSFPDTNCRQGVHHH
jgi:hypothetical protein